jgi:hypothetical protein
MDQPKSFWLDLFTWETWNEFLKPGGKVSGFLATPAWSVELFRYRGSARGGGTLEYVFEAGEQNSPNAVTKEKAAEIAADFMTTFYHFQIGALETQEFRTTPVPFWLVAFSDTTKGAIKQLYFVVVLPNGKVVEPSVRRRL